MGRPGKDPQGVEQPREILEASPVDETEIINLLHDLSGMNDEELRKLKNKPWCYYLGKVRDRLGITAQIRDRGKYDDLQINKYLDIYLNLCDSYNKGITFYVFGKFIGVDDTTITEWGNLAQFANSPLREVYRKIKRASEETVRSYATDAAARGNGLAMALLANHDHGWDDRGKVAKITGSEPSTDAIVDQIGALIAQKVENNLKSN